MPSLFTIWYPRPNINNPVNNNINALPKFNNDSGLIRIQINSARSSSLIFQDLLIHR